VPKQQAVKRSGVAGGGGDEAMRQPLACLQAKLAEVLHAAWRGTPCRAAMPSQRSRSPNRAPAHAVKRHKAACAMLGVRRSCTILSSFAHYRAGGERRWSGSAIGAAWLLLLCVQKQRRYSAFALSGALNIFVRGKQLHET